LIDRNAVAEDQARAGASERLRRPYLLTSVPRIAKARIVWLLVLALSAVLTVQVLELFEATLSQQVALALFIPLLIGIGGNTGSQAATTITRALALGDVGLRDILKVASKEVRTGLLLGIVLALLAFAVASPFYGLGIGTVIGLTLLLNCPIAATVGGVIPLVARACRVDPAVFSTPFISTFCDATGLLVYFTVAVAVLGL
jgi:magnesium transporter